MARYRHYQNRGGPDDDVFVTTTCLDFALLFARSEMRSAVGASLLGDLDHYGAVLHAYVVMPHHVHLVVRAPSDMGPPALMQRLKKNAADRLLPLLEPDEAAQLSQQEGLDGRRFWKRSFRSLVLERDRTFWQKVGYVHENPVRAGLAARAEDYPWSSAQAMKSGRWSWEEGCLQACLESVRTKPPD